MCGRFSEFKEFSELKIRFHLDELVVGWDDLLFHKPRYNIAPTQIMPIVCWNETKNLCLMRRGLVPSWAKDKAIGNKMINARAETLAEKPAFKRVLASRRGIAPATGFYEWMKTERYKIPMHIIPKDRRLFRHLTALCCIA